MDDKTKVLYREVLERYVKIIWTHKIHLCQTDIYRNNAECLNNKIIILSVLVSCSAITNILHWLPDSFIVPTLAILSLILTYYTSKAKSENFVGKASENERFASLMHNLRNKYAGFLSDIKSGSVSCDQIITIRRKLESDEDTIYSGIVPYTSPKAVEAAEKALKFKQDSTTTDEEIKLLVSNNLQIE